MTTVDKTLLEKRPLSYSSLKEFSKSPRHYIYYLEQKRTSTPAQEFGSLIDCLLLTPDKFESSFAVCEDLDKRTKDGKAKFEAFVDSEYNWLLEAIKKDPKAKARKVIYANQVEEAKKIIELVKNDASAARLLNNLNATQYPIKYTDKETGLPMVMYLDGKGETNGLPYILEVKTCTSAKKDNFLRDAIKFDYPLQTGTYTTGMAHRGIFPDFYYLCIETEAPYGVNVFKVTSDWIKYGKTQLRTLLDDFKFCMNNNMFEQSYGFKSLTGYSQLDLPFYLKNQ
jgi:hypothetical protein